MKRDKVLCVIRVSTLEQELISQHNDMLAFCISLGYSENQIVWLESAGASARKLNAKYLQLLDSIKSKCLLEHIKAVAVFHLNRLGRREEKLNEMKQFFIKNGIQLYIKNPSLILLDDNGKVNTMASMFYSMLAVSIEVDTEELIAKTSRGRAHNTSIGKFNGGPNGTLFGYRVKEDGFIEIDSVEAQVVRDIYNMYATGEYSMTKIALELRERGIKHRGNKFSDQTINKILHNGAYWGEQSLKFPQIVDTSIVEKTRIVAQGNNKKQTKQRTRILMANKILKCKLCGSNYIAGTKAYFCYKNVMAHRVADGCTDSPSISFEKMDSILIRVAKQVHLEYLTTPDNNAIEETEKKIAVVHEKIAECDRQRDSLKIKKERLQEIYLSGDISKAKYETKTDEIKREEKALGEQNTSLLAENIQLAFKLEALMNPSADSFVKVFMDLENEKNRKEMQSIVRMHISEAWIEKDEKEKVYNIYIKDTRAYTWRFKYYYTLKSHQIYEESNGNWIELITSEK